jgi:hypothetical protein
MMTTEPRTFFFSVVAAMIVVERVRKKSRVKIHHKSGQNVSEFRCADSGAFLKARISEMQIRDRGIIDSAQQSAVWSELDS